MTGYLNEAYAASLAEFGTPHALPASGGWVLIRRVPGATSALDAMGCYPIFACRDWRRLGDDVGAMANRMVSLTLVADPFGPHDPTVLHSVFPDMCRPFKAHFVHDLAVAHRWPEHHRRRVRRAERAVAIEICAHPIAHAAEWIGLYAHLIERHGIRGLAAFSAEALTRQLAVPGLTMLRATRGGETLGITLWCTHGAVAYYHLGASSPAGYLAGVSYALFARAIDHFRGRVAQVDFGAGAGASSDSTDGLSRFKRGWATGTRTAWLCGRILDRSGYETLAAARGASSGAYFPAYRAGEFA